MVPQLYTSLSEGLHALITKYSKSRSKSIKLLKSAIPPVLDPLPQQDLYDAVYDVWEASSGSNEGGKDGIAGNDVLRSSVELLGKEIVWEVAYEEPLPGSSAAERCVFNTRLQDTLDVVLTLYEVLNDDLEATTSESSPSTFPDAGTLFLPILEDMVDLLTLSTWEVLFGWLESRSWRLTENMPPSKGKSLVLLKTLNLLLRSVSKTSISNPNPTTSELEFRARIQIFLSTVYKLSDMGGVNSRGDYADVEVVIEDPILLDGLDGLGDLPDIYKTLWSLQAYFSQPTIIVPTPSAVAAGHTTTLAEFKKKTDYLLPKLFEQTNTKGKGVELGMSAEELFSPKYATSSKLLSYQLSDPSFRLQIYAQFVLFFDLLQHLHDKVKKPKILQFPISFTVSAEDYEWTRDRDSDIREEMLRMGDQGKHFKQLISNVLKNEKHHVIWKGAGCYPFELPSQPEEALYAAEKKRRKANEPLKPYAFPCGTKALSTMNRDPLTSAEQLKNFKLNETLESLRVKYDKEDLIEKEYLEMKAREKVREEEEAKKIKEEVVEEPTATEDKMDVDETKESGEVSKDDEEEKKTEEVKEKKKEEPLGEWVEPKASLSWRAIRMILPENINALSKVPKGDLPTLMSALSTPSTLQGTPLNSDKKPSLGSVAMTRAVSSGSGSGSINGRSVSGLTVGGTPEVVVGSSIAVPTPAPGLGDVAVPSIVVEESLEVKMEGIETPNPTTESLAAKDADGDVNMS